MKKLLLVLPIFLMGVLQGYSQQKLGKYTIPYYTGSYEQFKGEIIDQKKPGIVLVISNRQWKSKDFEINLNEDSALVAYIDSNFIAYRVDTEEDYTPVMDMRLDDVPAVVVYDTDLKIVSRIEGKKYPDGLLQILQSVK
jgi:hypothetical protein